MIINYIYKKHDILWWRTGTYTYERGNQHVTVKCDSEIILMLSLYTNNILHEYTELLV